MRYPIGAVIKETNNVDKTDISMWEITKYFDGSYTLVCTKASKKLTISLNRVVKIDEDLIVAWENSRENISIILPKKCQLPDELFTL